MLNIICTHGSCHNSFRLWQKSSVIQCQAAFVRGNFSMLLIHLNLPSDDFFFVDGDIKLLLSTLNLTTMTNSFLYLIPTYSNLWMKIHMENLSLNKVFTPCFFFLFPSLSFSASKWKLKVCCVNLHPGSTKTQVSNFSTVVRS